MREGVVCRKVVCRTNACVVGICTCTMYSEQPTLCDDGVCYSCPCKSKLGMVAGDGGGGEGAKGVGEVCAAKV